MSRVWLDIDEIVALGVPRRTLYRMLPTLTTRAGAPAANGKTKREILLESLPAEIQEKFLRREAGGVSREPNHQIHSCLLPVTSYLPNSPASETNPDAEAAQGELADDLPATGQRSDPAPAAASPAGGGASRSLGELSEEDLARVNALAEKLREAKGQRRSARGEIAKDLGWSMATLDRKLRALEKHGLAGLARKPRADRGAARVADAKVIARVQVGFLKPYRPTVREVYRDIAADYSHANLPAPSYSFVRRVCNSIDPDLIARFRIGAKEFDDKFAYPILRKRPALPRQWIDGDHHLWDRPVIFRDGSIGRPWLTALRDWCTNEIIGFSCNKEQSARRYANRRTIAAALRHAILRKSDPAWPSFGIPENFYTDLGKDFRSQYIRAVCADLGCKWVSARPYHGRSKPLERWFRTAEVALKHLPGYLGSGPSTNPERQVIGAPRTWEQMRKDLITIDALEAELTRWIVYDYHHAATRALGGLAPIEVLEQCIKAGFVAREVRDERALDLLLMHRQNKKVQKLGIEMFGTRYQQRFYMANELLPLIGKEVEVAWNPDNLGELVVYHENRFVCVARNRELIEIRATEEDYKREKAIQAEQRRSVQERIEEMRLQAQYPDPLQRAVAERMRNEVFVEEQKKIAVGAQAPSAAVLMPKYAGAAKRLAGVRREAEGARKATARKTTTADENPWLKEDPAPTSDELFKREKNLWLEDE